MLKLFKKKEPDYIDLETYDYSSFARDMTEEELLTVNGGGQIENTNEAVANAKPGDTLTRNDNTTVVITQADIDWAKEQVGSTPANTATETANSSSQSSSSSSMSTTSPSNASQVAGVKRDSTPEKESSTILGNIARYRAMAGYNQIKPNTVTGTKPEGQAAGGNSAAEVVDPRNRGFTLTTDNYPEAYGSGEEKVPRNPDANGQPKNPVSPDNVVTNNPKEAGKNSKVAITDIIKKYNEKNNTNLPQCVESYNYLRAKGETFGYEDNGGWAKLQDTNNANRTMQEYLNSDDSEIQKKNSTMKGNYLYNEKGCRLMTAAKIASEIVGEEVSMEYFNNYADSNGDISLESIVEGINDFLESKGDKRRVEGKRYKDDQVNRALLDTISSSKDTIFVAGKALGVAGGPHWFELDGYSINKYGETQFRYYPSSDYDVSNDRIYLLGPKLFNRSSETGTDTIDNNIFSVSVIDTISLTKQF